MTARMREFFNQSFDKAHKEIFDRCVRHEEFVTDVLITLPDYEFEVLTDVIKDMADAQHKDSKPLTDEYREALKNRLFGFFWQASKNYLLEVDKVMTSNGYYTDKWEKAS